MRNALLIIDFRINSNTFRSIFISSVWTTFFFIVLQRNGIKISKQKNTFQFHCESSAGIAITSSKMSFFSRSTNCVLQSTERLKASAIKKKVTRFFWRRKKWWQMKLNSSAVVTIPILMGTLSIYSKQTSKKLWNESFGRFFAEQKVNRTGEEIKGNGITATALIFDIFQTFWYF